LPSASTGRNRPSYRAGPAGNLQVFQHMAALRIMAAELDDAFSAIFRRRAVHRLEHRGYRAAVDQIRARGGAHAADGRRRKWFAQNGRRRGSTPPPRRNFPGAGWKFQSRAGQSHQQRFRLDCREVRRNFLKGREFPKHLAVPLRRSDLVIGRDALLSLSRFNRQLKREAHDLRSTPPRPPERPEFLGSRPLRGAASGRRTRHLSGAYIRPRIFADHHENDFSPPWPFASGDCHPRIKVTAGRTLAY